MTDAPSCSILILAGGQGSRMGGADKGLVQWRGKPMVSWVHGVARGLTDDLIISCNRNATIYRTYADQLVADAEPGFAGPLAGIRAGLAVARHASLLILPCDCPRIDSVLVRQLIDLAGVDPSRPVLCKRGEQFEPLFSVLPALLAPTIEQAWANGERSLLRILLANSPSILQLAPQDERLSNLNTPAELHTRSGN
ncbi:molybdenum cofactor guanylyltransferase MobA [Stutzerimonas urumqiensis]